MEVTKEMTLGEVLTAEPETAAVFMNFGMHCLFCPSHTMESIADAAMVHGVDADELVNQVNAFLAEKNA